MDAFLIIIIIALSIAVYTFGVKSYKLSNDLERINEELESQQDKYSKLLSQKKSSEVRLGLISEKLAPFLDDFDFNPNGLTFLGNPIDYIHFGSGEITFIEVKSGKSRLSKKQRQIRDAIADGNINWYEFRIK